MKPWPFVSSLSNAHVLGPEAQDARERLLIERLIQTCRSGVFRRLLPRGIPPQSSRRRANEPAQAD